MTAVPKHAGEAEQASPGAIAGLNDAPASAKAILLACLSLRKGRLVMQLPSGRRLGFGGAESGPTALLEVRDYAFAKKVLRSGDIGFADGYIASDWDTPDLSAVLELFSLNADRLMRLFRGNWLVGAINMVSHIGRDNNRAGARRNIHAHYDLGNRFYQAWLDPSMTYSSACFDAPGQDLSAGQLNKYRALAEKLELKPGEHVLEIGCGWGGFAEIAARDYGVRVTGLTISKEQHDYAVARMQRAGLSSRVDIKLMDYRDIDGAFDKIASIEMFEAVGEKYWPAYFDKVSSLLKPGGRAALQIITIKDELFAAYRKRADFIQRYIFPGGMLPSITRLKEEAARAGLVWDKAQAFGEHYATTLSAWGQRFGAHWEEIRTLGFDERFKRLWRFYLSYCEAGFRTARTDVVQVALAKS
ncbi:MAG: cyclopropane-fatty-acyl-phospholipid synthase family protein [Pseudomonadota bacterium]